MACDDPMLFGSSKKRNQNRETTITAEFSEKDFLADILNNNYILVVGNEGLLDMNRYSSINGDLRKALLQTVNYEEFGDDCRYKSFSEMAAGGHIPNVLARKYLFSDSSFTELPHDHLSPWLLDLIRLRVFNIVFTTAFDDLLEKAMRKEWGDELLVVDLYDSASLGSFQQKVIESIGDDNQPTYDQPTLFYIFGKAINKEDCSLTLTDNDAIRVIHRWMDSTTLNKQVFSFITKKKIMAVGCNFDDWYMRFFWYILKRDIKQIGQGQIVSSTLSDRHSSLVTYLEQNGVYHEADAAQFMQRIVNLFTTQADNDAMKQFFNRFRQRGSVFLSYSSKDFAVASRLFMRLTQKGYSVWFDNRDLYGGNDYDARISKAIAECKAFMPLLTKTSEQLMEELEEKLEKEKKPLDKVNFGELPYVVREWRLANSHDGLPIVPVLHGGFGPRCDTYSRVFEGLVLGRKCTGVDLLERDGFDKLTASLDKALKAKDKQ